MPTGKHKSDGTYFLTEEQGEKKLDEWYGEMKLTHKLEIECREEKKMVEKTDCVENSKFGKLTDDEKMRKDNYILNAPKGFESPNGNTGSRKCYKIEQCDPTGESKKCNSQPCSTLVQYIIMRKDLLTDYNWSIGATIAQACHAALLVAWENREDAEVVEYLGKRYDMKKVILEVKSEKELYDVERKLKDKDIKYVMWREYPENIDTCIAVKPYPKKAIHSILRKLKMLL